MTKPLTDAIMIIVNEREVKSMKKWNINKVTYCAIRDWIEHKTIKTFKLVYNFAF